MDKVHNVQSIRVDDHYLYIAVDGRSYRIRWVDCSSRLAKATLAQREHLEVSPSGYGIHWPEIDEDLAITPLLQRAEVLEGTTPIPPVLVREEQAQTVQGEIREARAAYQAGDYVTIEELMLEQLEQQIKQLPPQEQLKLIAHISDGLTSVPLTTPTKVDEEMLRQQREKEADDILALCDEAAGMWTGSFDAAEEIRQMRRDRDEQIWPSRS